MSYPYSSAQLPVFYNYKPSSRVHNYVDGPIAALWPFGFGLSYTTVSSVDFLVSYQSTH